MHARQAKQYPALNTFLGVPNKFVRYKAVAKEVTPDYAFAVPSQKARFG
jgi:hypothetical protein